MEKVRPWCGQRSDRGRLKNRAELTARYSRLLLAFCVDPSSVVLYTLAESGFVGFYDPSAADNGDRYFVARSLRPVGVAFDPVYKVRRRLLSVLQ